MSGGRLWSWRARGHTPAEQYDLCDALSLRVAARLVEFGLPVEPATGYGKDPYGILIHRRCTAEWVGGGLRHERGRALNRAGSRPPEPSVSAALSGLPVVCTNLKFSGRWSGRTCKCRIPNDFQTLYEDLTGILAIAREGLPDHSDGAIVCKPERSVCVRIG